MTIFKALIVSLVLSLCISAWFLVVESTGVALYTCVSWALTILIAACVAFKSFRGWYLGQKYKDAHDLLDGIQKKLLQARVKHENFGGDK